MKLKRLLQVRAGSMLLIATAIQLVTAPTQGKAYTLMNFEGISDNALVLQFYSGGTDSAGNSGPNYGIFFSGTAGASVSFADGGTGNFINPPSGKTVVGINGSNSMGVDIPSGFTDELSFFYSSYTTASASAFTGLGGTGSLISSITLTPNQNLGCDGGPSNAACNWEKISLPISGQAKSLIVTGGDHLTGFDNIALGAKISPPADAPTPLPFVGLLTAFRWSRVIRRKAKAACCNVA